MSDSIPLDADTLQPTATQLATTILLAPCYVGWLGAVFLSGIVGYTAIGYIRGPLYARDAPILKAASILVPTMVLMGAIINAQEAYHYAISQKRDFNTISSFTVADCLAALPQGIVTTTVQIYLSTRAVALIQKNPWRTVVKTFLYTLVGTAWTFSIIDVIISYMQRAGVDHLLAPFTLNLSNSIWYWSTVVIDVTIVSILFVRLRAKLPGVREPTDHVLRQLIYLSLFTAGLTTFVALGGAISCSISINPDSIWVDVNIAFAAILPSLYAFAYFATLSVRDRLRSHLRGRSGSTPLEVRNRSGGKPKRDDLHATSKPGAPGDSWGRLVHLELGAPPQTHSGEKMEQLDSPGLQDGKFGRFEMV